MKSNQEWQQWGKADPLFAVAAWPGKEKGGPRPWTDAEFYALGQSDWEDFFSRWRAYGCRLDHCIEIGCGAGRLTKPLATVFTRVTALDVSPDQIAYAQQRIISPNVTFHVTDGVRFAAAVPPATAVFSTHVFQHFDHRSDAAAVFREVFQALVPGGTMMIHLPVYWLPPSPITPLYARGLALLKRLGDARANFNRRRGRLIMRHLNYDRNWLAECLTVLGFQRLEFCAFRVRSNQAWHEFVLAEKPPAGY